MKIEKILIFLVLALLLCLTANAQPKVKNVIFMIGDGMGLSQAYAAQTQKGENLTMLQLPYTGLVSTFSHDSYITDSAAAGTALSSGVKTNNGMIGITPDSLSQTVSIMEVAKQNGLRTGIGVTCSITHATPAAYYAHQLNRSMDEEIAEDLLTSGVDICIGGGRMFFENRQDGRKLTKSLQDNGYEVFYSMDDISKSGNNKIVGLLANEHLPMISQGRGDLLPQITGFMIDRLNENNTKGFFIMIEGSQIDWGGHANDQQYIIGETIDFDKAVKKAIDFAKADGNTLVIVTADHETGGMTLVGGNSGAKSVDTVFSTKNHSATPVPVYAFGPGAENFTGYFDNTEFKNKIATLLDIQ